VADLEILGAHVETMRLAIRRLREEEAESRRS